MFLPTSLVGSYPQPEWLIDRGRLAGRFPPRVRATELWRVAPEFLEIMRKRSALPSDWELVTFYRDQALISYWGRRALDGRHRCVKFASIAWVAAGYLLRQSGARKLLLRGFRVDPARGGDRVERLAFLAHGPVDIALRSLLTFLIGENGSGKTTTSRGWRAWSPRCAASPGKRRGVFHQPRRFFAPTPQTRRLLWVPASSHLSRPSPSE